MLLVRPSPLAKMAKAASIQTKALSVSFHLRHPLSSKPIPPPPLRFCTKRSFVTQAGNFHTPSAHRHHHHQDSRSTPPHQSPSKRVPSTLWSVDLTKKNWTLGVARDKPWAHYWILSLWCRGFYAGQDPTAGMRGSLVSRADLVIWVGRPWALIGRRAWQKLVFFRGQEGGGEG